MKQIIKIYLTKFLLFLFVILINCKKNTENLSSNKLYEKISNKLELSSLVISEKKDLKCGHSHFKNKTIKIYDPTPKEDMLFTEFIQINNVKDTPWTPIKIYFDYYDIKQKLKKGIIDQSQYSHITNNLEETSMILSNLIKVQRLDKYIHIDRNNTDISDCIWDPDTANKEIIADLAICVSTLDKENVVASAFAFTGQELNYRPINGVVMFNINKNFQIYNDTQLFIDTAIHELTHILVFSPELFKLFVDDNFKKIPIDQILKDNTNGRRMIITPRVVKAMRNHFGCDTAEGLELENDGGNSTVGFHWEKRIMYGDYMIGDISIQNSLSEITLALLEDSGWYKTNKFTGGLFMFGRKKGCEFLTEKCIPEKETKFKNEYCVKDREKGCSANRRWESQCIANKDIKTINFSDNCNIPIISKNGNKEFNNCFNRKDKNQNIGYINKTCFLAKKEKCRNFSPKCLKYKCNFDKKIIFINYIKKCYECPSRGGIIFIKKDKIVCPDFYFLCNQSVVCHDINDCVSKKSIRIEEPEILNLKYLINMNSNLKISK